MYYITKRDSITGQRFLEVKQKFDKAKEDQIKLADKYNIDSWRGGHWCVGGGFSAVFFKEGIEVDKKIWKNVNGSKKEWIPRLNNKQGKLIQEEFSMMEKVYGSDLNSCIGLDSRFSHIGVNYLSDEFVGFPISEEMLKGLVLPKDCEEVTFTKWNELFKKSDATN